MIDRLLALNREFYATFAESFANSRSVSDPALTSILPYLPQRASILDVGCGNGRLALLLDRERPGTSYVGVDAVPELIEAARSQPDKKGKRSDVQADQLANVPSIEKVAKRISVSFHVADITRPGWTDTLSDTPFDCAVALAVLHHIPDFDLRARVLRDIASVLTSDGYLILSTWQFLVNERMRRKIVDWAEVGIDEENLDPGDYLLDWKRGGWGLRYCHLVDAAEVKRLAAASGFRVRATFRAGGREGNLSLFAVLDKIAR